MAAGNYGGGSAVFSFGQNEERPFSFAAGRDDGQNTNQRPSPHGSQPSTARPSQDRHGTPVFRFGWKPEEDNDDASKVSSFSFSCPRSATPASTTGTSSPFPHRGSSSHLDTPSPERSLALTASSSDCHLLPPAFPVQPASSETQPTLDIQMSSLSLTTDPTEAAPKPYDIQDEPGPARVFFTSKFQSDLQSGLGIAREVVAAVEDLGDLNDLDPTGQKLLTEARGMTTFHGSDTRTIAVLGDSGEAPITIEAEYLSGAEIKDMIRELLWSYRQLFLPGVEANETSAQDYARYQRESECAWYALHAAFHNKAGFSEEFLRDMSDGASERIAEQLILWAEEIEWPDSARPGVWESTAVTADECCEKTKIFMQDRLWPFTKVIRVRATQDYLIKCDNIFIVAKIQRAITDQSIKSSLYWILSRHAPMEWEASGGRKLNVAVEINIKSAKSEFCGEDKRISSQTVVQLEQEIEAAKQSHDRSRKKEAKRRLEFLLIGARNAHVKQGLQRAYSSQVPGRDLHVFCVSNTAYEKYCRKGNREYVEASGVPELRRFCHGISADAQLNEARHFLHSRLAGLVNSLGLWSGSRLLAPEKPEVISTAPVTKTVEALREELLDSVTELRREFMETFNDQIMKLFAAYEAEWAKVATRESKSWEQYNAWCLHNGDHSTYNRKHVNWNASLIWKMRMETEFAWELVLDEVHTVFERLKSTVTASLENIKTTVLAIDTLIPSWAYKLGLEESAFHRGVSTIMRRSSETHVNSYILDDMMPSYRAASKQQGTGKAARQRQIVGGHVSEGTVFARMAIRLREDMGALVRVSEDRLRVSGEAMVERLKVDVGMCANRPSGDSPSVNDSGGDIDRIKVQALHQKLEALGDRLAIVDAAEGDRGRLLTGL
ncbi:hypothetical protein ACRE_024930 [Hapsidospora chrysogenum ATCC 11550]|uniref:DUF7605 domain-containing protein n=1 Tax=Hapsidospora chrysogenum (strain ATCC 11550 / CBS 779.69 / DSM 880 / IAM 14645 / JCM 23072 / IMI 49137) TaxID=857340 RepID=A0A086TB68_HAPC1|nr:hypothetical protein ACRE_024930 [Hapsidospora chrysogenum ATCC 11550]